MHGQLCQIIRRLSASMAMSRFKFLLIVLSVLCILKLLLILQSSGDSNSSSNNFMRDLVRSLPISDSSAIAESERPNMLDLLNNFNNFSYFYSQSKMHMDTAMHWVDYEGTKLPLMRLSADEESFEYRTSRAVKWLSSQSLAVMATVRNGMPGLRTSIYNLRRLCRKFAHCSIVFLENDSHDDTREFLYKQRKSDPSITLIGCGKINSPLPCNLNVSYSSGKQHQPGSKMSRNFQEEIERGLVMSALRNQILAYVYTHLANNHSLLLGIDPDLYWDSWSIESLLQGLYYFAYRPQLDSLCASSYYYNWGRRTIHDLCTLEFHSTDTFAPVDAGGNKEKSAASINTPWPIKVKACFQGLTFFRMKSLYNRRLLYRKGHGEWICEHNTLSRQLSENYIDPNMQLRVRVGALLL